MRNLIMLACVVISLAAVGCCGPMGCGPGCGIPVNCNECSGVGVGGAYSGGCGVAGCGCGVGPVCGNLGVRRACGGPGVACAAVSRIRERQPLQQLKRTLVCGSGCGETYIGEWTSTPPDAYDPCCGDQFVGGATKCRPFCWQRGTLLRGLYGGLYGQRYCDGYRAAATASPCGCGSPSCSSGHVGEIITESYDNYVEAPQYIESGAGCATCDTRNEAGGTRVAGSHSQKVIEARSAGRRIYR